MTHRLPINAVLKEIMTIVEDDEINGFIMEYDTGDMVSSGTILTFFINNIFNTYEYKLKEGDENYIEYDEFTFNLVDTAVKNSLDLGDDV